MLGKKRFVPHSRRLARSLWPPILAISLLASAPIPAQPSIEQSLRGSPPDSTQPARLYTEEEALTAAERAAKTAVDRTVPLAVQAAVAEERVLAASRRILVEAELLAARRSIRAWRLAALGSISALLSAIIWYIADGRNPALK
ncbi:MAG TPA: hypothetical protein VMW69_12155 [Spirochaetia bacterium]|nr:hypothetical protein [Spirochaetia bacterium]